MGKPPRPPSGLSKSGGRRRETDGVHSRNLTLITSRAARTAADVVGSRVHGTKQRGWAHLAADVHPHMAHVVTVNAGPIV